ncbi:RND transporter [Flaviaesturariibacter flavus]|uniref:RND transporter n=1 Tax=Flaviaesturariibacter flavus TaxID=2502780 RepID=A0A4R1BAT7_9BACT|nr:MMPL family transporter [Flaviaesturariibacter flavus]TCJ14085.1 RND transporter [Flaviaesturariibacter flavus]
MWESLGRIVLRYRAALLALLLAITAFMGWQASKVKISYEFANAIPTDNPKYAAYQAFRRQFGEDGNLMVVGVQTDRFFQKDFFDDYRRLQADIRRVPGVEGVLSVPAAVALVKNDSLGKLEARAVFPDTLRTQADIDSAAARFGTLPFYRGLLYNAATRSYLMAVTINGPVLQRPERTRVIGGIVKLTDAFSAKHKTELHLSGLPLIRTQVAVKIQNEMRWFTIGSFLLSAIILLFFFRSVSATLLSLAVVAVGVIWSFGILQLMGYKITLLTALIPPLVVVIGIPNCIYFLNKYHTAWREYGDKNTALVQMIAKMGVVTLFCNIAAAIGFAVFALTRSAILREFGAVAGIAIGALFFISLLLIPPVLSYAATLKARHLRYLDNAMMGRWLGRLERWSLHHRRAIWIVTGLLLALSIAGITRLKSVGYIVDDLPKTDKIYADLKFFESQFGGVMPLEIVVDAKKKRGLQRDIPGNMRRVDSLVQYLRGKPYIGRTLALTEIAKFVRQAFYDGDSSTYGLPSDFELPALKDYLSASKDTGTRAATPVSRLLRTLVDSNSQRARISSAMMDVGSARLPGILDSVQARATEIFDTSKYNVQITGGSVTFLEGSRFIINGLQESILWAFALIALCMLYLFRSGRILLCSLLPNVIPLVITAGVMGWAGVPLKPSTVLVFSVTLGIAIDITIRFLVNYKQGAATAADVEKNVVSTIHSTGLSIIYTSLVLIAGFVIFCFSGFGGTKALGWLTSLTLVVATVANLTLLPALLLSLRPRKTDKS